MNRKIILVLLCLVLININCFSRLSKITHDPTILELEGWVMSSESKRVAGYVSYCLELAITNKGRSAVKFDIYCIYFGSRDDPWTFIWGGGNQSEEIWQIEPGETLEWLCPKKCFRGIGYKDAPPEEYCVRVGFSYQGKGVGNSFVALLSPIDDIPKIHEIEQARARGEKKYGQPLQFQIE